MNHERTTWLVALLLVIVVVVPTSTLVWFISESVQRETAAANDALRAAYREQLRLIRGRIDAFWSDRGRVLTSEARRGGASAFQRIVVAGLADSIIVLNDRDVPLYPSHLGEGGSDADPKPAPTTAARAAQANIRALVQAKNISGAVAAIQRQFGQSVVPQGTDADGRVIAVDELLLAIHLLRPTDGHARELAQRLASLLNSYDDKVTIPAAQRIFAMHELGAWGKDVARFPTLAAEELGASFFDGQGVVTRGGGFHRSVLPDVWTFVPADSHVMALYRTSSIRAALDRVVAESSSAHVRFSVASPGDAVPDDAIAASE